MSDRRARTQPILLSLFFGATVSGCAGPTTPLGAIWSLQSRDGESSRGLADIASLAGMQDAVIALASPVPPPTLRFNPPRQVLHGRRAIQVIIDDEGGVPRLPWLGNGHEFRVRYHGHDVTRGFLLQAKFTRASDGKRLVIEVPSLRLKANAEHLIEMGYRGPSGQRAVARYPAPVCRAFESRAIRSTDEFKSPVLSPELLRTIESVSLETGFSPAFTAALIAQESSFNPRSVSFARAVGLTQVTPIAETEVAQVFARWPRYPGLNDLPAPIVKALVLAGHVNASNEWRLHPERSIRGGLAFARMLSERWLDSEGFSKVRWSDGAEAAPGGSAHDGLEVARTRLILASYNSGYSRVLGAIRSHGAAWLTAPELKEARQYVNRIFSYCDAFGQESPDAPETAARAPAGTGPIAPSPAPSASPTREVADPTPKKKVPHANQT